MLRRPLYRLFSDMSPRLKQGLQLGWYLYSRPSSQKILLLVGQHGTGKSTFLQSQLQPYLAPGMSKFYLSLKIQPEMKHWTKKENDFRSPMSMMLTKVIEHLDGIEEIADKQIKEEIATIFTSHMTNLLSRIETPDTLPEDPETAQKVSEKLEKGRAATITTVNQILAEEKSSLRVSGYTEKDLISVVRDSSPCLALQIFILVAFGSGKEAVVGELVCPLISNLLDCISRYFFIRNQSNLTLLFVIENIHNLCIDSASCVFLNQFIMSLIKYQEHFNVILEGSGLYGSSFQTAVSNEDKFIRMQIEKYTRPEFETYVSMRWPAAKATEIEEIWKHTKGIQTFAENFITGVEQGKTIADMKSTILKNLVISLDNSVESYGVLQGPIPAMMPFLERSEQPYLRALTYFLSHMVAGDDEVEMTHEEFFENKLVQHLCMLRICYYDIDAKRIKLENQMIREALPLTKMWKLFGGPNQLSRNRTAYQKILSSSQVPNIQIS